MASILDNEDVEELDLIARTQKNNQERTWLNKKLREYDNDIKHKLPNHLRGSLNRCAKSSYAGWNYKDVDHPYER